MAQLVVLNNFLVPAYGKPGGYQFSATLVAGVPQTIDFRGMNLDGVDFWPYGVYVNNNDGTAPCEILLDQLGLVLTTAAGASVAHSYPGMEDQSVTITGEGLVNMVFVNYPIVNR